MSSWISKTAKNVFKPNSSETPQSFVIACPQCGQSQQGLRQADFQRLTCKACQTALFVLPRDVYPAPRPDASPKENSKEAPATLLDEEIITILDEDLDEFEGIQAEDGPPPGKTLPAATGGEALPSLSELRERIRAAGKPKQAQLATAIPRKQNAVGEIGTAIGELGRDAQQEFVRFWTPFRILSLTVVVIITITAGWTWRQSVIARAVKVARQESELGRAAIAQKNWTQARDHLQLAAAALDRLGRTDPESQTIRQYARETQAQFRLCDLSLEELLTKAQESWAGQKEKKRNRSHLVRIYEGDWMLFEGTVREVAAQQARQPEYQIQLPIGPGGRQGETVIRMNFPVLEKLMARESQKDLIVAGAIENVEFRESGEWVITLAPSSGFLWTHMDTYEASGLPFNPLRSRLVVESQLREQAQAMGVPE